MGRQLRSRFNLMLPCNRENVDTEQNKQKEYYKEKRNSKIKVGDKVMAKDYSVNKNNWTRAIVTKQLGNVVFLVKLINAKVVVSISSNEPITIPIVSHSKDDTHVSLTQQDNQAIAEVDNEVNLKLDPVQTNTAPENKHPKSPIVTPTLRRSKDLD
ncbi:hypothetical protein Trydic_g2178 [Trypoxylus dichotomus]